MGRKKERVERPTKLGEKSLLMSARIVEILQYIGCLTWSGACTAAAAAAAAIKYSRGTEHIEIITTHRGSLTHLKSWREGGKKKAKLSLPFE